MEEPEFLTRPVVIGTAIFLVGCVTLVWIFGEIFPQHIAIPRPLEGIALLVGIPVAWYFCVRFAAKVFGGKNIEDWRRDPE